MRWFDRVTDFLFPARARAVAAEERFAAALSRLPLEHALDLARRVARRGVSLTPIAREEPPPATAALAPYATTWFAEFPALRSADGSTTLHAPNGVVVLGGETWLSIGIDEEDPSGFFLRAGEDTVYSAEPDDRAGWLVPTRAHPSVAHLAILIGRLNNDVLLEGELPEA